MLNFENKWQGSKNLMTQELNVRFFPLMDEKIDHDILI